MLVLVFLFIKFAKLKIYYQNVRGLRTKTHNFYNQICCNDYDIVILVETWLNNNILSHELFDNRYTVYRRDRETSSHHNKKDGGGVLIAVNNKYISKRMNSWESECEDVWVTVDICLGKHNRSSKQIALCAVYLPPPVSQSVLDHYLDKCNYVCEHNLCTCIVGDFNLSLIDWASLNKNNNSYVIPGIGTHLVDFVNLHKLCQANNIPNKSNKILDLVLTNIACEVFTPSSPLSIIDLLHPPLEVDLSFTENIKLPYNANALRPNFYKADYEAICKYLHELNWEDIFHGSNDVNYMLDVFYEILQDAIKRFVPFKIKGKQNKYPPWFDRNLRRILNEKNVLRLRYKLYKNPMDEISLSLVSDRASRLATAKYNQYVKDIEQGIIKNTKLFWTFMKVKKGGKGLYPANMSNGVTETCDGFEICNLFAEQFSQSFRFNNIDSVGDESTKILEHIHNYGLSISAPSIPFEKVLKALKSVDREKGAGPDGIPPLFVASCASALATPLYAIFNKSLKTGIFPNVWKAAMVVPIHKSDKNTLVQNYTPISILSTLAKIFECLVCPLLQNHLKHFFTDNQHGFIGSRSTSTNLVTFTETLVNAVDKNKQIDAIYTDFSKAFDSVPHEILVSKLRAYGFTGNFLEWINSYLNDRTFFVVVNGYQSNVYKIFSGVPQGSHLGPILFNVFINDISSCFQYSSVFLYADDLKFIRTIETSDDCVYLQKDLDSLIKWCENNKMMLNKNKCCYIKFSRKHKSVTYDYHINDHKISDQ